MANLPTQQRAAARRVCDPPPSTRSRAILALAPGALVLLSALACAGPQLDPAQQNTQQSAQQSAQAQPGGQQTLQKMPALGQQSAQRPTGPVQLQQHAQTGLMVPAGWRMQSANQGNVLHVKFDEPPGDARSPSLGLMSGKVAQGVTAAKLAQVVMGSVQGAKLVNQRQLNAMTTLTEVAGTINNIPARVAIVASQNPQTGAVAYLAAPPKRYAEIGGAGLVVRFANVKVRSVTARRNTPTPTPTPRPGGQTPAPANININDYNTQVWLLNNPAKLPASTLLGKWSSGMSVPTGSVYESINTGALSYGSMGYGHLLEFRRNGTYAWAFRYAHNYGSCRNRVHSMEVGRYRFDGRKLVLQPTKTDADLCACCAGNRMTKMRPDRSQRVFEVAFHQSGRYAVLRGTCTKAAKIRCVGPAGQKYLRIAMKR